MTPVAIDMSAFEKCRVLVVGDLMIDEYVWGTVDRISPEAPVQIVAVDREEYTLGGAGNVVNNLAALGASVSVAGVIGPGPDGDRLMARFAELNTRTEGIVREPDRPTTRKTRILAGHQQVLRIDRETRRDISEETFSQLTAFVERILSQTDVVLVSDYGKGLITRRFLARLTESAARIGIPVIGDPKGIDFTKYAGVTLLTPNQKEAGLASGIEIVDEESRNRAAERLLSSAGIDNLLITCGQEGMVLYEKEKPPFRIRSEAKQVFDVSGAGDTVAAVFGLAVAAGRTFAEAASLANTAAGIVVGKLGTATVSPAELAAALKRFPDEGSRKYKSLAEMAEVVRSLKGSGKTIVLTNGCFDLLHAGHIQLFSAAREMGDVLVAAIDDDPSVRKLKGPGRPVLKARERVRILSALDSIDYVVVFATEELDRLIDVLRPDVLAKGSNYASEEVAGHGVVERIGGRVALIPVTEAVSSTGIINSIREG